MSSSIKKQSASVFRAFVRAQIVMLEIVALGVALYFIQQKSANAQTSIAILLFCVFAFILLTGKGFPHFRHRGKALLVLTVTGFFAVQGATIVEQQREAHLTELRARDSAAYLTELRKIDEGRWFEELRELDPDAHAAEADRRAALAEAERLAHTPTSRRPKPTS